MADFGLWVKTEDSLDMYTWERVMRVSFGDNESIQKVWEEAVLTVFEDLLDDLEDEFEDARALDEAVSDIRERIAGLLSPTPVSRDELARLTRAPARVVLAALVELELAGRCEIWPNGMVCSD